MPKLTIAIKCGERTCAAIPGQFCGFLGTRKFGQQSVCLLFPTPDAPYTILDDVDGWVRRCGECLCAEALPEDSA